MGALFRVPVSGFDAPEGRRVALVAHGGTPLPELELSGDVVFVLGAERDGLPKDVLERCDALASIPQHGDSESLNVAMAGTIALVRARAPRTWLPPPRARALHGAATSPIVNPVRVPGTGARKPVAEATKNPAPLPGPLYFTESVALSSTSANRPSASGLPLLRRTAWSRFRPSRAPCSLQGGRYGVRACRSRGRAQKNSRYLRACAIHTLSSPPAYGRRSNQP